MSKAAFTVEVPLDFSDSWILAREDNMLVIPLEIVVSWRDPSRTIALLAVLVNYPRIPTSLSKRAQEL
jgi:hypothetical protein